MNPAATRWCRPAALWKAGPGSLDGWWGSMDRLVMMLTGVESIRDVIGFPNSHSNPEPEPVTMAGYEF